MQICFAVVEILGAHRNGGIGTATSHLAVLLADAGHDVTLLYCGDDALEMGSLWHGIYRRLNIKVVHLRTWEHPLEPSVLRHPVAIFEYLRGASFDVVFFQESLGLGQACVLAKRAGIAFARCHLSVIAHGNTEWVMDTGGKVPEWRDQLLWIEAERQSVEFADSLISPSAYLVDWMRQHDWKLPAQTFVIQNYLGGLHIAGVERPIARRGGPLQRHLIFFGRLEPRKGIYQFLEALREPALKGERFELSFLGREAGVSQEQIMAWLGEHRPDLQPLARFCKDKDVHQALNYLKASGGIAVLPSLADNSPCAIWECIEHAIPFVASNTGGIPELVADDVRDEILVVPEPGPLAARLRSMLDVAGWPEVRPKQDHVSVGRAWLEFLDSISLDSISRGSPAASTSITPARRNDGRIAVLLLDRGDEATLRARLGELCLQTCGNFDTIIVSGKPRALGGLICKQLEVTCTVPESSSWSAAILAGAQAATAELLVVADPASVLSSQCIEALRLALTAFPEAVVTGQLVRSPSQARTPRVFFARELPRQGFLGGPLCLGVFENCFGGLPFGIRRDVLLATLSPDSRVADIWPLLTTCTLAGHRVLSLPIPLATEPPIENTTLELVARDNHRAAVGRLYRSQVPTALRSLVHIGPFRGP
jgi:glycosyltransferase involved in cell wall biosynthesis